MIAVNLKFDRRNFAGACSLLWRQQDHPLTGARERHRLDFAPTTRRRCLHVDVDFFGAETSMVLQQDFELWDCTGTGDIDLKPMVLGSYSEIDGLDGVSRSPGLPIRRGVGVEQVGNGTAAGCGGGSNMR